MTSLVSWDDVDSFNELDSSSKSSPETSVAVIGAGLVGSLTACMLAQRGYNVDLYEYRSDIRKEDVVQGRSINMTIAIRGLEALQRIGIKDTVLSKSIPLYGRMIHNIDGSTYPVSYGVKDQATYSISRAEINKILITHAESHRNITMYFKHKLETVNIRDNMVDFAGGLGSKKFDTIISADGSYSKTRAQFLRDTTFNFSQEYLDALYIELSMLPDKQGNSKMDLNYLHVWPRGSFMLMGLPNQDMSWTMSLFGPKSIYSELQTREGVMGVFRKHFPDAIELIEEERILELCLGAKGYPMVSVKCSPHVLNSTMLIGDAAHAMVPFYGEGMNCGFEDALVLDDLISEHKSLHTALQYYSQKRCEDVHAMCDLAMYNYIEIRDLIRLPTFRLRKAMVNLLHGLFPDQWIPLYTSIRFQRKLTYKECMDNKKWQDEVFSTTGKYMAFLAKAILVGGVYYGATQEEAYGLAWAGNQIVNTGALVVEGICGYLTA